MAGTPVDELSGNKTVPNIFITKALVYWSICADVASSGKSENCSRNPDNLKLKLEGLYTAWSPVPYFLLTQADASICLSKEASTKDV
jgi:hypothetical protein